MFVLKDSLGLSRVSSSLVAKYLNLRERKRPFEVAEEMRSMTVVDSNCNVLESAPQSREYLAADDPKLKKQAYQKLRSY